MKVEDLATLLGHLSLGLKPVAAAGLVKDLDQCRALLSPFQNLTLSEFATFLSQCDAYKRDGIIPVKGGPKPAGGARAAAKSPERSANALSALRAVFAATSGGTVDRQQIDVAVQALSPLTLAEINTVLAEAQLSVKAKSKPKLLEGVREALDNRAEAAMRVQTMRQDR